MIEGHRRGPHEGTASWKELQAQFGVPSGGGRAHRGPGPHAGTPCGQRPEPRAPRMLPLGAWTRLPSCPCGHLPCGIPASWPADYYPAWRPSCPISPADKPLFFPSVGPGRPPGPSGSCVASLPKTQQQLSVQSKVPVRQGWARPKSYR